VFTIHAIAKCLSQLFGARTEVLAPVWEHDWRDFRHGLVSMRAGPPRGHGG